MLLRTGLLRAHRGVRPLQTGAGQTWTSQVRLWDVWFLGGGAGRRRQATVHLRARSVVLAGRGEFQSKATGGDSKEWWTFQVFSQNVNNVTDRPNTADGPAHTDHHQLGYST